jgi:5'-3' exonuclease
MKLHLVDGTYELFRSHYGGGPPATAPDGRPVKAIRGLIQTLLLLLRGNDVTHVACAFDHVVESFRNDMFDGYKTGEGVSEELLSQFGLAERAASALGLVVWPMVDFEADDAIATATHRWSAEVDQVVVCSPDKDLAQLVRGGVIVTWDRRHDVVLDELGVIEKFGVPPRSIPDLLALVGDAADGIPGVRRWGAKSASAVLSAYKTIDAIPPDPASWSVKPRGAVAISSSLEQSRSEAKLYKDLATLRFDVPIAESLDDLEWRGVVRDDYLTLCDELGFDRLKELPHRWAD